MKTLALVLAMAAVAFAQDDKEKLTKILEDIRAQKARLEEMENQILKKLGETKSVPRGEITSIPKDILTGFVAINMGREHGVQPGDVFKVFRDVRFIAMMQAVQVEPKSSQCKVAALNMGEELKAGDKVEKGNAVVIGQGVDGQMIVKDLHPEIAKELGAAGIQSFETRVAQHSWLPAMKETNKARYLTELEVQAREVIAKDLAARWKEAPAAQKPAIEAHLKRNLEALYDAKAKAKKLEIEEIDQRLKKVKEEAKEDSQAKQKFVAARLKELTGGTVETPRH